tara:strand:- start:869 stop:1366 length:498 start_codon:yes stop_codon:yes gene_type:complete
MKIMVFGHKRHGKDTVCEILRDKYAMTFASSSEFSCHKFIYEAMRVRYFYKSPERCFEDRVNHRQYWFEAIRDYNAKDRSRLGREIFNENDIYCGIRDKEEFVSLRNDELFDVAVWVDASGRLPPEDASSMTLDASYADIVLDNNGSLEELIANIDKLVMELIKT